MYKSFCSNIWRIPQMRPIKFSFRLTSSLSCNIENAYYQEQYILPGTSLRGALAGWYLNKFGEDEKFDAMFNRGENRFPFLFVAHEKMPMIKAAKTTGGCKRDDKHPFVSRINDLWENTGSMECENCQQAIKPYTKYLGRKKIPLERSIVGHTSIHEETNTASPHGYFRELLISPQESQHPHFCGYGYLDEQSFEILQDLCRENQNEIMLGKSRNQGKGWGILTLEEANDRVIRRAPLSRTDLFAVHCVTPAILLDPYLRPDTKPPLEWEGKKLSPIASEISTKTIGGWSAVHSLPKTKDVAIDIGSVFLFEKTPEMENQDLFQKFIEEMEKKGWGERKIEGYGEIRINELALTNPQEVQ